MVFNNETETPSAYAPQENNKQSETSNLVRLVEDPTVEKTIKFDEISVAETGDSTGTGDSISKNSEYGLSFPMIRINDRILARHNIMNMTISMTGFMPTIRLTVMYEDMNFVSKNMPKDGDMISVYIRSNTDALTYLRDDFIITSCSASLPGKGSTSSKISFTGKLFIPSFDSRQGTDGYVGTSKEVLREIAKNHGIGFAFNDYDDTDDYQGWIRCKESCPEFISNMISHTWKDETSFFKAWVDLYYNLCFVNVNKFLLSTENDEQVDVTFATNVMNLYHTIGEDTSKENAKMAVKMLSNMSMFNRTPFFIKRWTPHNMASTISMSNGYSSNTYTYVHNQNIINTFDSDCFEILRNIPAYDQKKTDDYILLRGRSTYDKDKNPSNEQARVNYNYVDTYNNVIWTGVEYALSDDDRGKECNNWSGNVHKNFNRAPYHNSQNISELNKLYLTVECEGLNLQIMKGERIPVYIVYANEAESLMINQDSDEDAKMPANRFYSGYYIVDSIEYDYNSLKSQTSPYTTRYVLKRREWPTPETIQKG